LASGNHVATIVTFEPTGNFSIQRLPGQYTATNIGGGFGDMNPDKIFSVSDIRCSGTTCNNGSVEDILYSQNTKFKAAFDVNADGLGDNRDLFALGSYLLAGGAGQDVLDSYTALLLHRADVNGDGLSDAADINAVYSHFGPASWTYDMNVDTTVNVLDVSTMLAQEFRTKPGDFNLDGAVDAADYVVWRKSLGSGTMYTQGDANFDGTTDANDLAVWRNNYGFVRQPLSPGSGASVASVPEANALTLFVVAALLLPSAMMRWRAKTQFEVTITE
jgi:hypothetical protein